MNKKLLGVLLMAAVISSCKKDLEQDAVTPVQEEFSNHANPFKDLPIFPQAKVQTIWHESGKAGKAADYCTSSTVTKTAGYDTQILLDPSVNIIYPGSIIVPQSLNDGTYQAVTPITVKPITLSVSLQGVQGTVKATVPANLSDTRDAINTIINQKITGEQAGQSAYTINQIYSEDQLKLAIGASVGIGKLVDVKATYNFNSTDTKTRIVANYLQTYYTVDMDVPKDGVFASEVPPGLTYSPVYVSSVSYGRMGLFFLESASSSADVNASLEASFSWALGKAGASVSTAQKNIINSSTIKVYTTGGSGSGSTLTITGFQGFVDWIQAGGKFGINNRGAILAYQLKNLKDHTVHGVSLTSTYTVRQCPVNVYRYYNSGLADHYYDLVSAATMGGGGWNYEAPVFRAFAAEAPGTVPVYSYIQTGINGNARNTDHYYSTTYAPVMGAGTYMYETVRFYAYKTHVEGTIPIYGYYHNSMGVVDHYLATENTPPGGFVDEGVAFYAFPK